jgi:hypothetical protein
MNSVFSLLNSKSSSTFSAAVIVTLGFPEVIQHWTNGQVLNFIHLMWGKPNGEEVEADLDREFDPLNFFSGSTEEKNLQSASRPAPLEASVVVEVAKKAYESLVANGVDVFSRRSKNDLDHSFDSPLAGDAIMIESLAQGNSQTNQYLVEHSFSKNMIDDGTMKKQMPTKQTRSFVAPPESRAGSKKQDLPDPARKQRIVEWLCSNIQHLNELAQFPFESRELWRLHQHYFTPVVNESGGEAAHCGASSDSRIVSSVPDVSRGNPTGSLVIPSTESSEGHFSVPISDPIFPGSPNAPNSLPILKRKVSYRVLGDAMLSSHGKLEPRLESNNHNDSVGKSEPRLETNHHNGSVAKMIEGGHTGHSLPPKTKRARRNRTRISFLPRIKEKLDSYLDVCHEKALITMRQLYFVEQAILNGKVNPLEPSSLQRIHLGGILASEAEMIIVDMI